MTVYVDDMRRPTRVGNLEGTWSHLLADTTEELTAFAVGLGLNPAWLQHPGTSREHFDITDAKRTLALRLGARPIAYGHEGAALTRAKREGRVFDVDEYRATHGHPDDGPAQPDLF